MSATRQTGRTRSDLEFGLSAEAISKRINRKAQRVGSAWRVPCIGHSGVGFNLAIKDGDGGSPVFTCHSRACDFETIRRGLAGIGIGIGREGKKEVNGNIAELQRKGFRVVAVYRYEDAAGNLLYENVRLERNNGHRVKTFRQRRPDGREGWTQNLAGIQQVPYRLPALAAGSEQCIDVCEGEKDADRLATLGLLSTSIATIKTVDLSVFKGRTVLIHEDNDAAGREKTAKLAAALQGIVAAVHVVRYQDAGDSGDVSDWLDQGHSFEDLLARRDEATTPSAPATRNMPEYGAGEQISEVAIGNAFAENVAGRRRYEHRRGRWYRYSDGIWRVDDERETLRAVIEFCEGVGDSKFQQLRTIRAVEEIAKVAHGIRTTSDVFDVDAYMIGTPAGHVDLRTGELLPPNADRLITMSTPCVPSKMEAPTRWLKFLEECTGGDKGTMRLLQQMAGYFLTGDVREHCLFFLYGGGRNGKGVYIRALNGVLGSYSWRTGIDTFSAGPDKHPTMFASMVGKRLVWTSETEQGRKWAAARIKDLSGGDPINARFMRQDEFTFQPTFKLLISGNHQPTIADVDDAIRGRFHVIPFDQTFAGREQRDLDERLKAEWPGILQWAIDGCLDWQHNGFVISEKVAIATEEYFAGQDMFSEWIDDKCTVGPEYEALTADLLPSWNAHLKQAGEPHETTRALAERLKKSKRFPQDRSPSRRHGKNGRFWRGIAPRRTFEMEV